MMRRKMLTKLFNALMMHILLLGVVLLSAPVLASVDKPFDLTYEFPAQGIALNTATQVSLEISDAPAWSSGVAELTVIPFPYVVPDSNADNLQVERQDYIRAKVRSLIETQRTARMGNGG
jgi:hypothetical protein